MFIILGLFSIVNLWFLYKRDLRISAAGKLKGFIHLKQNLKQYSDNQKNLDKEIDFYN